MLMAELSLWCINNDVKKQWKTTTNGQLIPSPENESGIIRMLMEMKKAQLDYMRKRSECWSSGVVVRLGKIFDSPGTAMFCPSSFRCMCPCVSRVCQFLLLRPCVCLCYSVTVCLFLESSHVSQQMAQGCQGHGAQEAVWLQTWSMSLELICILSLKRLLMQSGSV